MEKHTEQKMNETAKLVNLCSQYCKILDKHDTTELNDFLEIIALKMMEIYKQTFDIAKFQTRYESEPEKFLSEKQYNNIIKNLREYFGKKDIYNEIIDPVMPASNSIFQASLAEDLTDIYQDFYDFVEWYSLGTLESINDSVIECLNNFEKYWGIKLLSALRAIHMTRYYFKDTTLIREIRIEDEVIDNTENEIIDSEGLDDIITEEL